MEDLKQQMFHIHIVNQEATQKKREYDEALTQANRPGPPPPPSPGDGAAKRGRTLTRETEVAAIPEHNPEYDAAMDRAVVIAQPKRAVSLDDMKNDVNKTVGKIRKITTPSDVIPDDAIPPQLKV